MGTRVPNFISLWGPGVTKRGGPHLYMTPAHINENRHQEEDIREADHGEETDNILDYAIEYRMTGSYPPGLTKDKKRSVID